MSEVFRVEKTGNYTVMSNYHLRDERLTLKAKGLLCYILSLPDDWDYTMKGLAAKHPDGITAVRSCIKMLVETGYIRHRQTVDSLGRFSKSEYFVYEKPLSEEPFSENLTTENPTTVKTISAKPRKVKPISKKPTQLNTNIQNTYQRNTDQTKSSSINHKQMLEERRRWEEVIKTKFEYDLLRNMPGMELLDVVINTMLSTICSFSSTVKIKGERLPKQLVVDRLLSLDETDIAYALAVYDENKENVSNAEAYLLPILFEAPDKKEAYYTALHDKNNNKGGGKQ